MIEIIVKKSPSLNKLKGRWALSNWKKAYLRQMRGYDVVYGLKKPKKALLYVCRYAKKALDYDNLVGGCKPLIDAIKELGMIVDDNEKWVKVTYTQTPADNEREFTKVKIKYVGGL